MNEMKNKIFRVEMNKHSDKTSIYNKTTKRAYTFSNKDLVIFNDENIPPIKNIKVKLDLEVLDI